MSLSKSSLRVSETRKRLVEPDQSVNEFKIIFTESEWVPNEFDWALRNLDIQDFCEFEK